MEFEPLIKEVEKELVNFLGKETNEFKREYKKRVKDFLKESEADLKRWVTLLSKGLITKGDFTWLLKSRGDLVVMTALYSSGFSAIRLEQVKNKFFDTILSAIFRLIFPIK